jgi:hypothetical protein
VLYEIDGQPALNLYKKYLGDRAVELPGLVTVSFKRYSEKKEPVVRTILGIDNENQSMILAGDTNEFSCAV